MPAYVTLPGTSGNYFDTPDVNLLDADTAHFQQSVGKWSLTSSVWSYAATVETPQEGSDAGFGKTLTVTRTGGAAGTANIGCVAGSAPASPGDQLSASIYIWVPVSCTATALMLWWNSGGSNFSSNSITGSPFSLTAGWNRISGAIAAVAPATTASASFNLQVVKGSGNWETNDSLRISNPLIQLAASPSSSWVPSLRIVGDLEAEWKVALDDYTPANNQVVVSTFDQTGAVDGYQFGFDTSGQIFLRHGSGSNARAEASSATGLTDGTAHVFKVTIDVSTGAVVYYIDGVQHDTDTMPTGAASPNPSDLYVGSTNVPSSYLDGDLYYVIVRDGIDGPIVARFDADDWVGV